MRAHVVHSVWWVVGQRCLRTADIEPGVVSGICLMQSNCRPGPSAHFMERQLGASPRVGKQQAEM